MSNAYAAGRNAGLLDNKLDVPLWYTTPFEQKQWREGYKAGREDAKTFGVTANAERMVAPLRAAYAEANNGADPYSERDWAIACQEWLDSLLFDVVDDIVECTFGTGYHVQRPIQPVWRCECCTKPALPEDIYCRKHRQAEDALAAKYVTESGYDNA